MGVKYLKTRHYFYHLVKYIIKNRLLTQSDLMRVYVGSMFTITKQHIGQIVRGDEDVALDEEELVEENEIEIER
jgi:uncharacterized protein YgbK (DUF1537 family)